MAADGKAAMAESESTNGVNVIRVDGAGKEEEEEEITLIGALSRLLAAIFVAGDPSSTLLRRARTAIGDGAASVRIGCRNSSRELLRWTRRGSPLRPLLVVSVSQIEQYPTLSCSCYAVVSTTCFCYCLTWIR